MKKKAALLSIWLLCAAMAGCRDREAEFLKEAEETDAGEDEEQENTPVPSEIPEFTESPKKQEIYVDVCGPWQNRECSVFRKEAVCFRQSMQQEDFFPRRQKIM